MTDIVAFLNARLDEDEQLLHAACGFRDVKPHGALKSKVYTWWLRAKPGAGEREDVLRSRSGEVIATIRYLDAAAHIARHGPARVLREVKAKRRVLERHYPADEPYRWALGKPENYPCDGCGYDMSYGWNVANITDCPELRDMASIYDEHPDYNPAWAGDVAT